MKKIALVLVLMNTPVQAQYYNVPQQNQQLNMELYSIQQQLRHQTEMDTIRNFPPQRNSMAPLDTGPPVPMNQINDSAKTCALLSIGCK